MIATFVSGSAPPLPKAAAYRTTDPGETCPAGSTDFRNGLKESAGATTVTVVCPDCRL